MQLLTPFEFVRLFPEGQSLVVIGNAPSLKNEGLGEWIDSHDVVVRFNECALDGYAEDVGYRTSILVSNPYPEGRERPLLDGNSCTSILIVAPQTRRGVLEQFRAWAGDNRVLFTYTPDLIGVSDADHKAGLTTGSYALHLLSRLLKPSRVSCAGFTMFLEDTSHHYWRLMVPKGIRGHDMRREAEIFIRICNNISSETEVTEDIAWVSRRVKIPFRKSISIRSLRNPKWRE